MKKLILILTVSCAFQMTWAQRPLQIEGEVVFENDDVIFHKIDDHTWIGSGHVMSNESIYLLEGSERAMLIDAGTTIKNLDEVVAKITDKPVSLYATHAHPDHVGSAAYFSEINLNKGETENMKRMLADYQGKVGYLEDGQVIDLGDREIEVVFTPAHTPGSTTYIDKEAGYGFSGDSFGSGNLLLFSGTFSDLIATCEKMGQVMDEKGIGFLYPGHFNGTNPETRQRISDMVLLSQNVLSGKEKGEEVTGNRFGFTHIINKYGVRINYSEKALK